MLAKFNFCLRSTTSTSNFFATSRITERQYPGGIMTSNNGSSPVPVSIFCSESVSSGIVHQSLLTYFDPPVHYARSAPYAADRIFGLSERIHAPPHQGSPPRQTVVDKHEMFVRIVKEFRSMIPSRMYSGFRPDIAALPVNPMDALGNTRCSSTATSMSRRAMSAQTRSTTSFKNPRL